MQMTTLAALQLALALLPLVQTGVSEFILWINQLRGALQQSGEWTDAQEAAYRTTLYNKTGDLAYGPDPASRAP